MSKIQVLKNIHQTIKDCIKLEVTAREDPWPSAMPLWTSKFGGMPYLPKSIAFPCNEVGEPMHLLAQINFVDMPALESFPLDGIIQIYINHDEFYGMDHEQIDSGKHICFGDSGIACFLILREDLKNLNFSRVIYYWDCC